MSVNRNIAQNIHRYKQERHLSIAELSEELGIAKSAAVNYLNGTGNPRTDTLELLAEKCGMSAAEIISAQPPGWERAEIEVRAARTLGSLPPEQRNKAVNLFLALVDVFSAEEQI